MRFNVAVTGMSISTACANNLREYWNMLERGVDCVSKFPTIRFNDINHYCQLNNMNSENILNSEAAFLPKIDMFDNELFEMTPKEAELLDPSHRLFSQISWEALCDAGYNRTSLSGMNLGYYAGYYGDDTYAAMIKQLDPLGYSLSMTGNMPSMLASRLAYTFNTTGPAITINTSCSSSLVAIYMACLALENHECDIAIAGGVQIHIIPYKDIKIGIESSTFRTHAFDESASGTGTGEGCGVIVLKRLNDALSAKDKIYAVVNSGAINHDGSSAGITVPNLKAQKLLLQKAWDSSGFSYDQINYIEAHGTGTKIGDMIEVKAMTEAFLAYGKQNTCAIGTVKSNIGHLDAAAGIAGFIKAALICMYRKIPPSIHYSTPNHHIDFDHSPVYVCDCLTDINSDIAVCGISSFGISGTNCHIVISSFPDSFPSIEIPTKPYKSFWVGRVAYGKKVVITGKLLEDIKEEEWFMAELVADILGIEEVDVHANLMEMGLDSVSALGVIGKLNCPIQVDTLLNYPSIEEFVNYMKKSGAEWKK